MQCARTLLQGYSPLAVFVLNDQKETLGSHTFEAYSSPSFQAIHSSHINLTFNRWQVTRFKHILCIIILSSIYKLFPFFCSVSLVTMMQKNYIGFSDYDVEHFCPAFLKDADA